MPEGLNPISRKKYLISNLIICFCFPRACVRYYIGVILFLAFNYIILFGGSVNRLIGKSLKLQVFTSISDLNLDLSVNSTPKATKALHYATWLSKLILSRGILKQNHSLYLSHTL